MDDITPDNVKKQYIIEKFKRSIDKEQWVDYNFDIKLEKLSTSMLRGIYDQVSNQLQKRNGYVVEFNKTISSLTCCNNAVVLLGNSVQSKTALFYFK